MAYQRRSLPSHNKGKFSKAKTPQQRKNAHHEVMSIKKKIDEFARTSWGRQWVQQILQIGRPYRMERALLYAKENRIDHLNVTPGQIFATVQGTAPTPYRVKIQFQIIPEEGWDNLLVFISSKVKYIIALLENQMPLDIEDVFKEIGFSLYPDPMKIQASCSCPDNSKNKTKICKHIAATILYVALVIDFDPFILFKLRGREKTEILTYLMQNRSCGNQPISQTYRKIRDQVQLADNFFDNPMIAAENIEENRFAESAPISMPLHYPKPTGIIETLDSLGTAPNIANPDDFDHIMREIYLTVMKKAYLQKKKFDPET